MKRLIAMMMVVLMIGAVSTPVRAAEEMDAIYINGTVSAFTDGTTGKLDASALDAMKFQAGAGQVTLPFAGMTEVKYCMVNRFRLGVLGAIAVGLVKARSKRHLITIIWNDDHSVKQAATFEVSKEKAEALWTTLGVRAQQLNLKEMTSSCEQGWPN